MTDPLWKNKYGSSPVYKINRFIQDKLVDQEFIDINDYINDLSGTENFIIPFIIPGQDVPELTTIYDDDQYKDLEYVIYSVSQRFNTDEPMMYCGQATYTLYSGDVDKLIAMSDYLSELLRREDWSAQDINYHFMEDPDYEFDFKWISVLTSAGPTPSGDEGGRYSFMISIRYDATYEGKNRNYTLKPGFSKELGMR